jgi:hypothetical protein
VLVVYTPAARAAWGSTSGMLALINLGVTETNNAYAASGVIQRLRLVYAAEVSYSEESGTTCNGKFMCMDRTRLQGTSDGYMDVVHTWRNQYGADLVHLITDSRAADNLCGQASGILATADTAFGVTDVECISPNYTFAHELGHNMGARHDVFVDSTSTPYPYGHGYVNTAGGFRTIMAYPDACGYCDKILRFSNPASSYEGWSTGTAATADVARVLNNTRVTIANFRQTVAQPFSKIAPTGDATGLRRTVTLQWGPSIGAVRYEYCIDSFEIFLRKPDGVITPDSFAAPRECPFAWTSVGTATSVTLPIVDQTRYDWQVRAIGPSGDAVQADDEVFWWRFYSQGYAGYDAALRVPLCTGRISSCDSAYLLPSRGTLTNQSEPNQPNTLATSTCADGSDGGLHTEVESIEQMRVRTLDGGLLMAGKAVQVDVTIYSYSATDNTLDLYYAANTQAPSWQLIGSFETGGTGKRYLTATYVLPTGSHQAIRGNLRYLGSPSPCSSGSYNDHDDLAFSVANGFAEPALAAGTPLRASHIVELRTRINTLRLARGLPAFLWTDPGLAAGYTAKVLHLTELRAALLPVYTAAGEPAPTFMDATIAAQSTPIRALHITQLREAIAAIE